MDVGDLKQAHHRMWAAGEYARIAELIEDDPPLRLVSAVGIEPGMTVLDVATGTGNVAIPAAAQGAQVTGLDLTPELFDTARRRAAEAGVEVEWVEGDAEELPFEDGRFDRVLSAFGVMFAPRHEIAVAELVRVTRPGGVIGLISWTPEGFIGQLFKLLSEYMPPPPSYASPPPLWGSEAHLQELFGDSGVTLEHDRVMAPQPFDSGEEHVSYFEANYGPTVTAKQRLGEEGTWDEFRDRYVELTESFARTPDGGFSLEQEYLLTVASKAG
jgi:SAM-dependent methyltransferase